MSNVCEVFGMTLRNTPNYTPQANPTERVNRVIKTMISCYIGNKHNDWDVFLPEFAHAINTAVHSATGYTPFYLNFGREICKPSVLNGTGLESIDSVLPQEWVQKLKSLRYIYMLVRNNLENAYKRMSHYYNLRRRDLKFKLGDLVLKRNYVQSSAIQKFSASLAPKFLGPFRVSKVISPLVYALEDKWS